MFPIVETVSHLFISLFVFILGAVVILYVKKAINVKTKIAFYIYFWHTFFSMIYMYLTLYSMGGDSLGYYARALQGNIELEFGTHFIDYVSYILVSYFNLPYLGLFLFFNIIGSIGLVIFYAILYSITRNSSRTIKRMAVLFVFLPSISFWSSAIGKDAISFLAIVLALWAALNLSRRTLLMAIAIVLMLLVRPHMAGILVISLLVSMLIGSKKMSFMKKLLISSIIFPIAIILVPFAGKYAGIQDVTNAEEINSYIESRQSVNMDGGSSLDITSMSLPVKVFTYLLRPLPHEVHSITSLLSSIDNLLLLGLFLYGVRFLRVKKITISNHTFMWVYVAIATFLLSSMTPNLGIAVRQKWMIMPILIYLLFAGISAYQLRKRRIG